MIINKPIKTTGESIDYLNKAVFGEDPDYTVLSRVYESPIPIQDRVKDLETNRVNEATVEALQAKVDSLEALTTMFANLAYPVPNFVANGDLTLDSNSDGIPDGFAYYDTTNRTLINGIATFTATAKFGRLQTSISITANNIIYYFASVKATSTSVYLVGLANIPASNVFHSGNGEFQFLSNIQIASGSFNILAIGDNLTTGFSPISVDYVGAFNVSTMKIKGIKDDNGTPFTLLTNSQIKTQIDLWMATQFPLEVLLQMNS